MEDKQLKQIIDIVNIGVMVIPTLLQLITTIGNLIKDMDISDSTKEDLIKKIEEARDKVVNLPPIE